MLQTRNKLDAAKDHEADAVQRAISSANSEIKSLQESTAELREELEKAKLDKEEQYKLLAQSQNEIKQLKDYFNSRNGIEDVKVRHESTFKKFASSRSRFNL